MIQNRGLDGVWAALGRLLGGSWTAFERFLAPRHLWAAFWALPGELSSCSFLGASWTALGLVLAEYWGVLGRFWGRLGHPRVSWRVLGGSGARL